LPRFFFFQCIYFSTSTCFKRQALIIRREQLYQNILWYNTLARWLSEVLVSWPALRTVTLPVCYTRGCIDTIVPSWWWALVAWNM
jgi:hypothetical protein